MAKVLWAIIAVAACIVMGELVVVVTDHTEERTAIILSLVYSILACGFSFDEIKDTFTTQIRNGIYLHGYLEITAWFQTNISKGNVLVMLDFKDAHTRVFYHSILNGNYKCDYGETCFCCCPSEKSLCEIHLYLKSPTELVNILYTAL